MTETPAGQDLGKLIEALRAPSFEQDSQWHVPGSAFATKPRLMLDTAASTLQAQEEEIRKLKVIASLALLVGRLGESLAENRCPDEQDMQLANTLSEWWSARQALQPDGAGR